MNGRYRNLDLAIRKLGASKTHLRLVEVGTYDGERAKSMLTLWNAFEGARSAEYIGFDLFERMDPVTNTVELSKSRLPPAIHVVIKKLSALNNVSVSLIKGNTRDTLAGAVQLMRPADLIFIDGGHSLVTIASDWQGLQPIIDKNTIVLFDDYYLNRDDVGCKTLTTSLQQDPPIS